MTFFTFYCFEKSKLNFINFDFRKDDFEHATDISLMNFRRYFYHVNVSWVIVGHKIHITKAIPPYASEIFSFKQT